MGPETVGRRAAELALKGCDSIYMSFDIDVIDAGFSDGTGSVTMGAMTASTLFRILGTSLQIPHRRNGPGRDIPTPRRRQPHAPFRRRGPRQANRPKNI